MEIPAHKSNRPKATRACRHKTDIALVTLGCALFLTACDNHLDTENDQLQMVPPPVISESRAIELPNLLASLRLSDGREIGMTRLDNNTWTAVVRLPANSSQTLGVDWAERYKGRTLQLASADTAIDVGSEASTVNLGDLSYATDFDDDEDGKTNLAERNAGTDPYSAPTPGQPDVNVIIPRVDPANTPAIDGQGVIYDANVLRLVGEWSPAVQEDRLDETLYIENLMIDINADQKDGDPFHRWAALHDGTWLYVLVVSDDVGVHHSDSNDPPQDDNLELYFDGNNSKNNKYEDADDRFIQMPLRELNSELPNSHLSVNRRITAGFGSAPLPQTVEFSVGLGTGPLSFRNAATRQDVYEVRIPIADLGITIGQPFGIEMQLDDDDDGDSRDAKWGWFHRSRTVADSDETWKNPSLMGTAILE